MHLEGLIDDLDGFGRYQRYLVSFFVLFHIVVVPTMLAMATVGVEPDWWCVASNTSVADTLENGSYKNCHWNLTCERRYSEITIVSEWDLVCDKKWLSNAIISIQMAGVLIGAIISGYCADAYGRKKVLFGGLLLGTVGNLVAAFSVSWQMFTIMRFILGMSVGIYLPVLYLYMIEFVGMKWRGLIASLPSWAIGVVVFALLAWCIRNWMWLHIAIAALGVPFLLTWVVVPESLRWLTVKGHLEEARKVVHKIASVNKKPVPDTSILELVAEEERREGNKNNSYTYLDLFKNRTLTKKTLFTCYIWFCLSIVYYAISFGVKNLSGDFYMNFMIMAVLELPTFFIMLFMAYMFGRRWACAILFLAATIACFGVAIANRLAPEHIRVQLENGFAITAKVFTISAWGISQALTSEQFPTVIRNLAYAAQNTVARIGGILASQVMSLGDEHDLMPPFVALGILLALTALSCFTLEETRQKALEDTMKNYTIEVSVEDTCLDHNHEHHCCLSTNSPDENQLQEANETMKTDEDKIENGVKSELCPHENNEKDEISSQCLHETKEQSDLFSHENNGESDQLSHGNDEMSGLCPHEKDENTDPCTHETTESTRLVPRFENV